MYDLFTYNKDYISEFCNTLINSDRRINWSCSARADCLDNELIDLLKQAGCKGLFIGVETGSTRMQKSINKNLDLERTYKIISYAVKVGINVTSSFIIAFPDESYEDLHDSLLYRNKLLKLGVQEAHMLVLRPMQGSKIHTLYKLNGFDLRIHLTRINKLNYNDEALSLIRKYPNIFSYYYTYECENLTKNTVIALSTIISSDNFSVSEKLLLEKDIEYINFLKSFDDLCENASISDYENHYIKYISGLCKRNKCFDMIYEVAQYELDKLNFLRFVDKTVYLDTIKVCTKEYNYKVHLIKKIGDFPELISEKKKLNYVFYYSPRSMKIKIIKVDSAIAKLVDAIFVDKTISEISDVLQYEEIRNIPIISSMLSDYGI